MEEFEETESNVSVPLLDNAIDPEEVEDAIVSLKGDKSYIGVDTGLLKILPFEWIVFLTTIFNTIFVGNYPKSWCFSKLIILFKKGLRYLCGNYRGITIMNILSKCTNITL